jgi:hypothetical protein
MSHSQLRRLAGAGALGAAALVLSAGPALASEDGPAPAAPLPSILAPVTIPGPAPAPAPSRAGARLALRSVRIAPRRLRHGHAGSIRLTLSAPASVQVVLQRRSHGRLVKVATLRAPARGTVTTVRLPKRLQRGRYRVTITAAGARAVHRALVVV